MSSDDWPPWDDPMADPLAHIEALSRESQRRFSRSKFVMPPGISRVLDERYGTEWRDKIDRDAWIIQDEQEER